MPTGVLKIEAKTTTYKVPINACSNPPSVRGESEEVRDISFVKMPKDRPPIPNLNISYKIEKSGMMTNADAI
jgi:hypothetical protein